MWVQKHQLFSIYSIELLRSGIFVALSSWSLPWESLQDWIVRTCIGCSVLLYLDWKECSKPYGWSWDYVIEGDARSRMSTWRDIPNSTGMLLFRTWTVPLSSLHTETFFFLLELEIHRETMYMFPYVYVFGSFFGWSSWMSRILISFCWVTGRLFPQFLLVVLSSLW